MDVDIYNILYLQEYLSNEYKHINKHVVLDFLYIISDLYIDSNIITN